MSEKQTGELSLAKVANEKVFFRGTWPMKTEKKKKPKCRIPDASYAYANVQNLNVGR